MLILFALWFLSPLYVMLVTSLKDIDQIRSGSLLSLPTSLNFALVGQGLGPGLYRHRLRRHEAVLHEQRRDGGAGRGDLHDHRRVNGYVLSTGASAAAR